MFSNFLLLGDFNIDFLSQNHPLFSKLVCITSSFLFHQVVSHPIHFSYSVVPSIIDLVFVSCSPNLVSCNTISPLSTSDHMGIHLTYSKQTSRETSARPLNSSLEHFLAIVRTTMGLYLGKSTTSAFISYAHDCQEALDCGNELCSVFFDLSKAFDTVPHQQLLFKLFELQVNPFLIRWVSNYLTNRTQSVVLGGAQSNPLPVVSGVPQGSVLGPLLFLIYINGVSASVTDSKITLYADDIALYKIIRNPRDYTLLQGDSKSVCSWIADNHLVLNILKCCYMVFSRKHHPTLPNAPLYVGDSHALNK